jgi:hypothetical protein
MSTLFAAIALFAPGALASPGYPADLESELGMPCAPPCTVCHDSNVGGAGTVTAAFGVAMEGAGLAGGSQTDLLVTALGQLDADSDGDGTLDVDELAAGDDPNGGPSLCDAVAPEYGCFNQGQGPAGLVAVALAALAVRRARAPGRSPRGTGPTSGRTSSPAA